MTSYEDIEANMIDHLNNQEYHSDEATKTLRNLKLLIELNPRPVPPAPTPEPEPEPSWFEKHSDALIKSGFSLLSVLAIVGGEKLGNHLYNTKSWNAFQK